MPKCERLGKNKKSRTIAVSYMQIINLLFFAILFAAKGSGFYDGNRVFSMAMLIAGVLSGMSMLGSLFTKWELVIYPLITVLILYNYYLLRDKGLILCFMMFLMMKNCEMDKVSEVGIFAWGVPGLVCAFLALCGFIDQVVLVHDKLGGEILRYSFGQPHPNVLHTTYFVFSCFVIYLVRDQKSIMKWNCGTLLGSFFLGLYTVSYTGMLLNFLLFAGVTYLHFVKKMLGIEWGMAYGTLWIVIIASTIMPLIMNYESVFFQSFILSIYNRFRLLNRYYGSYPLAWFGQNINNYSIIDYQLDNSWAFLFLGGGMIIFCLVLMIYVVGFYLLLKNQRRLEALFVLCFVLGGMSDPFLFNTSLKNISILFLARAVYDTVGAGESSSFAVLPKWNAFLQQTISIKMPVLNYMECRTTWKTICGIGASSLIIAFIIMQMIHMPQAYVTRSTDPLKDISVVDNVLVSEEMLQNPEIRVFNYQGSETEMCMISTQRMRDIEYGRTFIGVWLCVCCVEYVGYLLLMRREQLLNRIY